MPTVGPEHTQEAMGFKSEMTSRNKMAVLVWRVSLRGMDHISNDSANSLMSEHDQDHPNGMGT